MEPFWQFADFARAHPLFVFGTLAAFGLLVYVLKHKPKLTREADEQIDQMCHDGVERYKKGRPLT